MPMIQVKTNIDFDATVKGEVLPALSAIVSRIIGKPHCDIMILFSREDILMDGTFEPAAFIDVRHISSLGVEGMKMLCEECGALLGEAAGIALERIYVQFFKVGDAFAWRFTDGAATCPRLAASPDGTTEDPDELLTAKRV
jgi:hypothetical protein